MNLRYGFLMICVIFSHCKILITEIYLNINIQNYNKATPPPTMDLCVKSSVPSNTQAYDDRCCKVCEKNDTGRARCYISESDAAARQLGDLKKRVFDTQAKVTGRHVSLVTVISLVTCFSGGHYNISGHISYDPKIFTHLKWVTLGTLRFTLEDDILNVKTDALYVMVPTFLRVALEIHCASAVSNTSYNIYYTKNYW